MPLKKRNWEIDELKKSALESNPKIKGLKYKIKSYEKQIQVFKKKTTTISKLEAEAKLMKVILELIVKGKFSQHLQ